MISRDRHVAAIESLLRKNRVVAVVGARQVGKSTIARMIARRRKGETAIFDLEDPLDLARLDDPGLALRPLRGLVVLDEIQRRPDLFPILRVLADRARPATRFLVLGSASPDLLRQSSESLAGRIAVHELGGFALDEIENRDRLWLRGGFPRSYLARAEADSFRWREEFVRTFLERDLPGLGFRLPTDLIRRFWTMLAHYHGPTWNASEFARSFGVADTTVRRYLDTLASAYVIRILLPWHANVRKRQVKAPKIYVADSGLLHGLLGLRTIRDLESHPKLGASWEGFLLGEVVSRLGARPGECHFWATHAGAELDLLVVRGARRYGFEFKRTEAPRVTPSMRSAMESLDLTSLRVIHAGETSFPIARKIDAIASSRLLEELAPLR